LKYTSNKNFNLPEYTDVIDIQDINENFEAIDANLAELEANDVGKNVEGETFTVDDSSVAAGMGAEIFNDYTNNIATGEYSHAEGYKTIASGKYAHAEGHGSKSSAIRSHAEGSYSTASNDAAHSEGSSTVASGVASHAEGIWCNATGEGSHAEGVNTYADGKYSHTEGRSTDAESLAQHVQGEYNIVDLSGTKTTRGTYAHIVGNGTSSTDEGRSNAHTLDWSGNAWFAGDVYVGSTSGTNKDEGSLKLATVSDASDAADTALTNAKSYTDTKITDLINGAPTTLDTLKEIADAMAANDTVVEALDTAIGTKANASDLTSHTGNKSNPHSVTKSQVGLGNVPNVATNDQTPTYTQASSLANLTSGEKLSVSFGKIMKAIADLISHLANKSNPHGVTAAQAGAVPTGRTVNGKALTDLTMEKDGIALVSFENGIAILSAVAGSFTVNATSPEGRG